MPAAEKIKSLVRLDMATLTLGPGGHFPNASPPITAEIWPSAQFTSVEVTERLKYNDLIVSGSVTFSDITVTGFAEFDGGVRIVGGDSSRPDEGALVVQGGVGILQNCNIQGYCAATTFNATSDERHKKEISHITSGLDLLRDVEAVRYKFRHFNKKSTPDKKYHYGVLAQDLQAKGLGDLVTKNEKTGTLSVDYNSIVGLLLRSVQELDEKVRDLTERLRGFNNAK